MCFKVGSIDLIFGEIVALGSMRERCERGSRQIRGSYISELK